MTIVTFSSDTGLQDFISGAAKGQLLQSNPNLNIVDLTHNLSPFNYPQAAYICKNSIKYFPEGSFHLILINLFDEKPEHLLLAKHDGRYFCCPDNGFLTMVLEELPAQVVSLSLGKTQQKSALYCVQVFSQAMNKILQGAGLSEVGDPNVSIVVKNSLRPLLGNNWIEGQIIFIDNFENVTVNITKEDFEQQRKGRSFSIVFKRDEVIDKISETYADVADGEKLALFNSAGYLEIAINKGNAASLFGLQRYSERQQETMQILVNNNKMVYQTVKIHFQ